jgi:hypothetical protein
LQKIIAELHVHNPEDKETQLTLALRIAIQAATAEKTCGVLITRHHYGKFTVALSRMVPYGQTHELDLVVTNTDVT